MAETRETYEGWVILELMGHRKLGGYLSEQEIAGQGFLRIRVPSEPPAEQLYSPSAVYCITPTTEQIARALAKNLRPEPVTQWELRPPAPPRQIEAMARERAYQDDDDEADEAPGQTLDAVGSSESWSDQPLYEHGGGWK